ncbi:MAG: TetR family transcriptional regulator [Alphaproteobacteria bacterium]|nr:TetR family transcriptional regulator [Alphaproteobacteria bacterium]
MTEAATPIPDRSNGRERILDEAMQLFAEHGFDSVTVRDIAAKADVSVGLINHHFGSKEGLREAVDAKFIRQFEEVLDSAAPSMGQMRMEDFFAWVDDWIARHQSTWPVTVQYFRRALLEESEWGASVFEKFFSIARASIDRMDAQGLLRPDVDRLWLPFLMVYLELGTSLLDPYVTKILGRSGFEADLWKRRHRAYLSLIYRGVLPPKDRARKSSAQEAN